MCIRGTLSVCFTSHTRGIMDAEPAPRLPHALHITRNFTDMTHDVQVNMPTGLNRCNLLRDNDSL
eukprot:jgi/Botrbrau1/20033/Bobra.200_1s0038.1